MKYIEALIGPDTVNTAPLETLDAYRDHGEPEARLEQDVKEARRVLELLPELGISIDDVTRQREDAIVSETLAAAPDLPQKPGNEAVESWLNEGNPNRCIRGSSPGQK